MKSNSNMRNISKMGEREVDKFVSCSNLYSLKCVYGSVSLYEQYNIV